MINISVLLTCHNRRAKTEHCLKSLKEALKIYNNCHEKKIKIEIFLTDDGCTDGTSEAARAVFPDTNTLHIFQGNGNLYWSGGMRFAWKEELKQVAKRDYYLLVNDDTIFLPVLFDDLMRTDEYCLAKYGKHGVYTGHIRDPKTHKVSFGGSTSKLLSPKDEPIECWSGCANVMFFAQEVVNTIGTFDKRYIHAGCDYDYTRMARKAGIPVLTTYSFVGECENEHRKRLEIVTDTSKMTFSQRKAYLLKPTTGRVDYLIGMKKYNKLKYYFATKPLFYLELYLPAIYRLLQHKRLLSLQKKFMEDATD